MHFTTIATVASMAAVVAAEAHLAAMPNLSLMRRADTYSPETTKCGAGNTCAEACGSDFAECPSHDNVSHCFNPVAKQSCCQDGSGNSCDAGYYCTHDNQANTVCCPEGLDLAACAAANKVTGGLESATPKPTPTPTPTPAKNTTVPIITETVDQTTTICPSGTGKPIHPGTNTTVSIPVIPSGSHTGPAVVPVPTGPAGTNAAAATSFSALLLVAAGAIALL